MAARPDFLLATLQEFLNTYADPDRPFLLAFSGGPDSLALMRALLLLKNPVVNFALAHVDHGWREESAQEAAEVASMAEELGLILHLKKLDPALMGGNLEAACREARYHFFDELCKKYGYQAVMLGHHADDLAETVLKRIFEGGALPYLSGMGQTGELEGVTLWRPILGIKKKNVLDWLEKHQYRAFYDKTNDDTRFMRARLRKEILPALSQAFGKEVAQNLCRLGQEAGELRAYMNEVVEPYLKKIERSTLGIYLDLSAFPLSRMYELRYLVKRLCELEGIKLSKAALQTVVDHLQNGSFNKRVPADGHVLGIDRQRLFIASAPLLQKSWREWRHLI